jgi:type I restriction enzyme S subunit
MERSTMAGPYPYYGAAKIFDYVNNYIFDGTYLLVAEDGSVITSEGFPVLQYVTGRFWANNHTHILQGDGVSTEYLYLALSRFPISGHVTGAAQPKVTQGNLNRIPVLEPSATVRKALDELLAPAFQLMRRLDDANSSLRATRNLLLPRLISGEIDTSTLNVSVESRRRESSAI